MKVLILGATGLLGNAVFRLLAKSEALTAIGVTRDPNAHALFAPEFAPRLMAGPDLSKGEALAAFVATAEPDVVINCAGPTRPLPAGIDSLLPLYALLPQRLSLLCARHGARLVQISSDAVFSGRRGHYAEDDMPDPADAYGLAKLLGEVRDRHAVTLRLSVVGPELRGRAGLLQWFLAQQGEVTGHARSIFSGLPSIEIARIIRDHVLPNPDLHGVWHLAAPPIAKAALLQGFAGAYGSAATIVANDTVAIDRSLDGGRFGAATGYASPAWPDLITAIRADHLALRGA